MGSKYKGRTEEVRALSAFINLMRAADSVVDRTYSSMETWGITASQFGVLEALYHVGPLCQCDLGAKLLRTGASITSVIDNLEKRGLVERVRSKEDRRFITVSLTGKGRDLIRKIFPPHAKAIAREFGVLTSKEQEDLRRLCRKLGKKEC